MNLFDLLRSDGSIVINKGLAHTIGLTEAIIYSELISLHEYWRKHNRLTNNEWFYCTAENLEKNTTIKPKTQQRTIKNLEKLGLIEVKMMGIPAKRHFKITDKIFDLVLQKLRYNQGGQNDHTSIDNLSKPEESNCPPNNTNNNTNKKNNNNIYSEIPERELPFYDWLNENNT